MIKTLMRSVPVVLLGLTFCQTAPPNAVLAFLTGAELQYEGEEQKEELRAALEDMLSLGEKALRARRYRDYSGRPGQWDAATVLYRHFVPARQGATLGNRFYRDLQSEEVQARIEEILLELQRQ